MVFLSINQSDAASETPLQQDNWFRKIQFLEMQHIISSCTNMSKIYGNKDAKSCTTWSFSSYREEEIHWETCWHVWQICTVSLNADTATRLDFTSMPSRPRFSLEINWKSRFARGMLQSLSQKDHSPSSTNPRYDQETFIRILWFLF